MLMSALMAFTYNALVRDDNVNHDGDIDGGDVNGNINSNVEPDRDPQRQSCCRKPRSRSPLTSVGPTPTKPEKRSKMKSESGTFSFRSICITCTLESLVAIALTLRGARTMFRSVRKLCWVDQGP